MLDAGKLKFDQILTITADVKGGGKGVRVRPNQAKLPVFVAERMAGVV